jgi:hypothetical protein
MNKPCHPLFVVEHCVRILKNCASARFCAATLRADCSNAVEHDPEKWKPVSRKDHAQSKRWDHDAIPCSRRIMI